ncbi:MAG: helix-turn-helix domain-containing protein [Crocinitomicaceae bacterium]
MQCQTHEQEEVYLKKVNESLRDFNSDSVLYFTKKLKASKNHCISLAGFRTEAEVAYKSGKYETCEILLLELITRIKKERKPNTFIYSEMMIGETYDECINILCINIYKRLFYIKKNQGKYTEAINWQILRGKHIEQLPRRNTYYLRHKIALEMGYASIERRVGNTRRSIMILTRLRRQMNEIHLSPDDIWYKNFSKEKADLAYQLGLDYECLAQEKPEFVDSAEYYLNETFYLTKKIDTSYATFLFHNLRMSEFNMLQGKYGKALQFATTADRYYKSEEQKIHIHKLKATCFSHLVQPDSAIFFGKRYLTEAAKTEGYGISSEVYDVLAKNYFRINELDSAYKYSNLGLDAIKTILREKQDVYSQRINDTEDNLIKIKSDVKKKKAEFRNRQMLIVVTSSCLLMGFVFLFLRSRRKQQKKFEQLQKEFNQLESTTVQIKSSPPVDGDLSRKILEGLHKIESSDLFLNSNFNAANMAKLLKTNTSYLSKVVNEHKGMDFRNYLMELRMNSLVKSLDDNPTLRKYSIEAMGNSIGYSNASSFTRAFKNHFGMTPSQYLKTQYG